MYELLEEAELQVTNKNSVDSIVLLCDNGFTSKKSYDINLLGASMYNWVVRACPSKPTLAEYNGQELLEFIRPMLGSSEYTLVLYSDTPLLTASGVNQMIDFVIGKDLSVARFTRAFVFKTQYIKNALGLYTVNTYDVAAAEQFKVDSTDSLIKATEILSSRIIKYHINNGVNIISPANTYIECSVSIGENTVVEPFVKLQGNTVIEDGCKVCSFASINDSQIKQNAIVKNGCNIVGSIISSNAIVGSGCTIINKSVVGEETIVGSRCLLDNATSISGGKIGVNSTLINTKLAKDVNLGSCVKCLGGDAKDVKVGSGATIGDNCTLNAGVYIRSDYNLAGNTTLLGE